MKKNKNKNTIKETILRNITTKLLHGYYYKYSCNYHNSKSVDNTYVDPSPIAKATLN